MLIDKLQEQYKREMEIFAESADITIGEYKIKEALADFANAFARNGKSIKFKSDSLLANRDFNIKRKAYEQIANVIVQDVFLIRSVHMPLLNDGLNFIAKKIKELHNPVGQLGESGIYVDVVNFPYFFQEVKRLDYLLTDTSKVDEALQCLDTLDLHFELPPTIELTRSLFVLTRPELYEISKSIVESCSDGMIMELFEEGLTNISPNNLFYANLRAGRTNIIDNKMLKKITLLYCFALKHFDSPPNLSLTRGDIDETRYREQIEKFATFLAGLITNMSKVLDNCVESDILVYNYHQGVVTLIEPVYKKFIENGGKAETIEAFFKVNGQKSLADKLTSAYILGEQSIVEAEYNKIKSVKTIQHNIDTTRSMKSLYYMLAKYFEDEIKSKPEEERCLFDIEDTTYINLDVGEYLKTLELGELDDYPKHAVQIFKRFVKDHSTFSVFYDQVLYYSKLNPDLSPEEITGLSAISIIVDFVFGQIEVTNRPIRNSTESGMSYTSGTVLRGD